MSSMSPYPGADVYADDAFQEPDEASLKARRFKAERSENQSSVKPAHRPGTRRPRCSGRRKRRLAGRPVGDVWSKVASVNAGTDEIAGYLAEVPFRSPTILHCSLGAMASVAIDLALNAVSAIPVAGWIIGIVVGIGRALASLFKGLRQGRRFVARTASASSVGHVQPRHRSTVGPHLHQHRRRRGRLDPDVRPANRRDLVEAPRGC
jgi:hypothetical protein